jgi:hypothetical protein
MALDMDRLTRPNKEKQVSLSKSGSGLPSIRGSRLVENGHHNTGPTVTHPMYPMSFIPSLQNHMRKADSTLSFGLASKRLNVYNNSLLVIVKLEVESLTI